VVNDKDSLRVISTANSARWVSVFYEVDDAVETVLAKGKSAIFMAQPRNYRLRLREGSTAATRRSSSTSPGKSRFFINHLDNEKKDSRSMKMSLIRSLFSTM